MTDSKKVLPGHETQSDDINCPSCGRFVGPASRCPYCKAKIPRRMSLVVFQWAAIFLATVGLFLLYLMARSREVPVVMLGNIQPTMNFGQIRVVGQAATDGRIFRNGGMGFTVSDGTGSMMVFTSQRQAQELEARNMIPKAGDSVNFVGGLNLAEDKSSMRLVSVDDFQLTRAPTATIKLKDITMDLDGSSVEVTGQVMDLVVPSAGSKRPYSLKLKDDSGEVAIKFWQTDYDRIEGKDVLNGAFVRARVTVGSYEGKLDLKLSSGADLEILDGPPSAPAPTPAQKAAATYRQSKPSRARDFSRGRSVAATSLSVSAVTADMDGKAIRVRGRVESITPPQEGTQQPFVLILTDNGSRLRVAYWPSVDEVIAIKPTPGALFEVEGAVTVYEDKPQMRVTSGYKVKLVNDMPASQPTVDESKAVPVSSISEADKGQTRVVKGVLGPARSLKSGVAYSLTDDSGTIDLILWNALVPEDVQAPLEEGVRVAATGEVGIYEGQLQIKAAAGRSVMTIR